LAKLNDVIAATENSLAEEQKHKEKLGQDIALADGRLKKLENQLKEVSKDLDRAQINKYQAIARTKNMQLEETLKFYFTPSKVLGRISSLCQPVSERYEMAVTRVLEKKMDFIVVDTEETAQKCIEYLKANKLKPETFLPIEDLNVSLSLLQDFLHL
jgi:structural maintenance of chromosome 1